MEVVVVVIQSLSRVQLLVTPWTVACQAPLFMELSRQEYWSALPFPSPEDLSDPGIELVSPALEADFFTEPLGTWRLHSSKVEMRGSLEKSYDFDPTAVSLCHGTISRGECQCEREGMGAEFPFLPCPLDR